jgi:hypothetical protein
MMFSLSPPPQRTSLSTAPGGSPVGHRGQPQAVPDDRLPNAPPYADLHSLRAIVRWPGGAYLLQPGQSAPASADEQNGPRWDRSEPGVLRPAFNVFVAM